MDERKDSAGKDDPEKTHICMPDTFAAINRRTARITAQIPNIGFIANDRNEKVEEAVSSKVMYDWDNGGVQRWQKKHVRQGESFGLSIRGWWWEVSEYMRNRGLPTDRDLTPEEMQLVVDTYQIPPEMQQNPAVLRKLIQEKSKRGLLNVKYKYKAYEGPRSEVLFVGDCYPEPYYQTLQTSNYFIHMQRRNKEWLLKLGKRFPQFQAGIHKLLQDHPKGSSVAQHGRGDEGMELRDQLRSVIALPTQEGGYEEPESGTQLWTVIARWTPGEHHKVAYVAEETYYLGEMDGPYDLDGKIPFTELTLIDSLLGGVGDCVSVIGQGLQEMHNVTVNRRFDLLRHVTHPLLGTTDNVLYDNPETMDRELFRLIKLRGGPNSVWAINDQQAMAAMAAAMGEEGAVQRMFQVLTGESNLSMGANVDPAQLRTATGAKLMQAGSDVLTKDMVDMFHESSVKPDVEMCYLLNRSEMADAMPIDASKYRRNYNQNSDQRKEIWITAEPLHFQLDGRLTVELGSTMADDEEAKVAKSTNLFTMLNGNPFVNQETLTRDLLIAHGKGPQLSEYMQQQQPAPPEPPTKSSISLAMKYETVEPEVRLAVLAQAGITPEAIEEERQKLDQADMAGQQAAMGMAPPQEMMPEGPPPIDGANVLGAAMQ